MTVYKYNLNGTYDVLEMPDDFGSSDWLSTHCYNVVYIPENSDCHDFIIEIYANRLAHTYYVSFNYDYIDTIVCDGSLALAEFLNRFSPYINTKLKERKLHENN